MNIVIAIIVLSVIVIIHEFGHFIIAKANGVAVSEFTIGLGPAIIKTKKKDNKTVFALRLFPFGGACIMAGEDGNTETASGIDKDKLFSSKSVWARISIIAAGPIFNFILAYIMAVFIIGSIGYDSAHLYNVQEGSVAYEAGIRKDDIITRVNGKKIHFYREYDVYQTLHPGEPLELEYIRDGKKYSAYVVPEHVVMDKYQLGVYLSEDSTITSIVKAGPAMLAGIINNDKIIAINGIKVTNSDETVALTKEYGSDVLAVTVLRNGEELTINVKPDLNHYDYYETGLVFSGFRVKVSPIKTLGYAGAEVKYVIDLVFDSLKMLFTGKVTKDDVAGPVGIVTTIGEVVEESKSDGTFYVILNIANMIVMLSANLGVMNLLPIPALDGGRLLFLFIEAVRGKPIDQKKEGIVHLVGMALLFILMFFIMFNDISKLFR